LIYFIPAFDLISIRSPTDLGFYRFAASARTLTNNSRARRNSSFVKDFKLHPSVAEPLNNPAVLS